MMASSGAAETQEKLRQQCKDKSEDTKYICTIGLEGEGSFTEVYKDRAECRQYCKGGATVCQKTAKKYSHRLLTT